eukprot:scaffold19162_cov118-Isochrysis_galbana.AAC.6
MSEAEDDSFTTRARITVNSAPLPSSAVCSALASLSIVSGPSALTCTKIRFTPAALAAAICEASAASFALTMSHVLAPCSTSPSASSLNLSTSTRPE